MKEVKFMAEKSLLIGRAIPLNSIFEDNRYLLREYREFKIYDSDGKPTETVGGYVYTVINISTFDKIDVKVEGAIPKEVIFAEKKNEKIFVSFNEAVIKAYYSKSQNCYVDTIKADSLTIIEADTIQLF